MGRMNASKAFSNKNTRSPFSWLLATKPRYIGAFLAGTILFGQLIFITDLTLTSAVITVSWLISGLVGGNIALIVRHGTGTRQWSGVLIGGITCVFLSSFLLRGSMDQLDITTAAAIPTVILYGFCKIGCRIFGCCNGSKSFSEFSRGISLQTLEATGSFLLAVFLIGIQIIGAEPLIVLVVFLIAHGSGRFLSRLSRDQSLGRAILSIDSGWLFLIGVLLISTRNLI